MLSARSTSESLPAEVRPGLRFNVCAAAASRLETTPPFNPELHARRAISLAVRSLVPRSIQRATACRLRLAHRARAGDWGGVTPTPHPVPLAAELHFPVGSNAVMERVFPSRGSLPGAVPDPVPPRL